MSDVTFDHFLRAAVNIGAYGDNDTLPFDIDVNFVKDLSLIHISEPTRPY